MKCASITIRAGRLGRRFRPRRVAVASRRPLRILRCDATSPLNASDNGLVKVKFTIPHHVEFGQSVCLLGSGPQLGDWDVEKSPCLNWNEGDIWSGIVELPPSEVKYKYFTKNPDGTAAEWQPCENLTAMIEDADEMEVQDEWDGSTQEIDREIEAEEEDMMPEMPKPTAAAVAEMDVENMTEKEVDAEEGIPKEVQDLAEEVVDEEVEVTQNTSTVKGEVMST